MKNKLISFPLIIMFFPLVACQQANTSSAATEKSIEQNTQAPSPSKKYTSPPIKDKSKIRDMLIREGKISSDLTESEINKQVNEFILKKQSVPCKTPTLPKPHPMNNNGE